MSEELPRIEDIFHMDNPATKAYIQFTESCNHRFQSLEPGTPYHIHHIVPKCWFKKYRPDLSPDQPHNMVCCTISEHIMMHMVLGSIMKDTELGWEMFSAARAIDTAFNEGHYFTKPDSRRRVIRVEDKPRIVIRSCK